MRTALALVLVSAVACGGGSRRSDTTAMSGNTVPRSEYTDQVNGQLVRLGSNARAQGFSRVVAGPIHGRLADDGTVSHELQVVQGNDYALIGACDNDCSDLDLKIFDTAGALQMEDVANDDTPVLTFTANANGKYRIEAIMEACTRNPCFYGIQLMAK